MITLGSDPEWFLSDGKDIVSAIGKIGGTKRKPRPIEELKGFFVQEDNVALEYNTPPASRTYEWDFNHTEIKRVLCYELSKKGLKPVIIGSHSFSDKELDDPRAWVFGCEPDFNVWDLKINPKPRSTDPNLRSAGGHIHIGYPRPNKIRSVNYAKMMDLFVGLPLMCVDPDERRMELYGKAGAIRFKKYGFEYRVPSNFWTSTSHLVQWAWNNTYTIFMNSFEVPEEVQHVINAKDKDAAKDLMTKFGVTPCPV